MRFLYGFIYDYTHKLLASLWDSMEYLREYIKNHPDDVNVTLLQRLTSTYFSEEDIEGPLVNTCRVLYEIAPQLDNFDKGNYTDLLLSYIECNEV